MRMKKYYFTLATLALFAIGFAASDEQKTDDDSGSSTQTEQTQETKHTQKDSPEPKEKSASEIKQEKIQSVLKDAERRANLCPESQYSFAEKDCESAYIYDFGTPSSEEDYEMYKLFKDKFMEIWNNKQKAKERMRNL